MPLAIDIGIILLSYVIGSIPFGLLIVKLKTGKDIREVESGRTGGTNAMRTAGFWAGFTTAMLDILKGAIGAWVAQWIVPDQYWVHVVAPWLRSSGITIPSFLLSVMRMERSFVCAVVQVVHPPWVVQWASGRRRS